MNSINELLNMIATEASEATLEANIERWQRQKAHVRSILENAQQFDWELKGLGMMRTYLSEDRKLHIWDSRYQVPNVSLTHEHPWSFESEIIVGRLRQHRLIKVDNPHSRIAEQISEEHPGYDCSGTCALHSRSHLAIASRPPKQIGAWMKSVVQCGPGGCLLTPPELVYLEQQPMETYVGGQRYKQNCDEIHQTYPDDGTVTIVTRLDYKEPRAAPVYWPAGTEWVSAEPVMATPAKIRDIAENSLRCWFD